MIRDNDEDEDALLDVSSEAGILLDHFINSSNTRQEHSEKYHQSTFLDSPELK